MLIKERYFTVEMCMCSIDNYDTDAPGEDCDLWINIFNVTECSNLYYLEINFVYFLLHTNFFGTQVPIMC